VKLLENMRSRAATMSLLLLIAGDATTQSVPVSSPSRALRALPGSSLTIRGSTTIGARWHCSASDISAAAVVDSNAGASTWSAVRSVSVVVPVTRLRCQSAAMDRAMLKAMRADSGSAIVGDFTAHARSDADVGAAAHLDGTLVVAGVQRAVRLDVVMRALTGDVVGVQSTMPLTLSAFNIARPRVLFGAVRARDAISVEIDLRFHAVSLARSDGAARLAASSATAIPHP
jgi:hypothetical protein